MMKLVYKPSLEATISELGRMRSEWWSLTTAHYEEAKEGIKYLFRSRGDTGLPILLHAHPRLSPAEQLDQVLEPGKGGPGTEADVAYFHPCEQRCMYIYAALETKPESQNLSTGPV